MLAHFQKQLVNIWGKNRSVFAFSTKQSSLSAYDTIKKKSLGLMFFSETAYTTLVLKTVFTKVMYSATITFDELVPLGMHVVFFSVCTMIHADIGANTYYACIRVSTIHSVVCASFFSVYHKEEKCNCDWAGTIYKTL